MNHRVVSSRTAALGRLTQRLNREVAQLSFGSPVRDVYNPLVYALDPYRQYLQRYAATAKRIVYLGMNPGPFGMAQTGIPFGEVAAVTQWLKIRGKVKKPQREHPKRPVQGFSCPRSEVSGARLWGAFRSRYKTPQAFFRDRFVANYCPLIFLEESGRNRTPDKLPDHERSTLFHFCDRHIRELVEILEAEWVIGIGKFAQSRAGLALKETPVKVGSILHPSPASPLANRGWAEQADKQLKAIGLEL